MGSARTLANALGWLPSTGPATLAAVAAVGAGAAALPLGGAGAALGLAALTAGVAALLFDLRRLARAEALADRLAEGTGGGAPLHRSLARLSHQLDAVQHRFANIHPVTGLPTREHLIERLAAESPAEGEVQLLGAVRLVDFDRLAAFDLDAANAALAGVAARIVQAARPGHVIGQVDRDSFAVWFRGADPEVSAAEFRAIVYVAGQEIAGKDAVLTPTLEAGVVRFARGEGDLSRLLLRVSAALRRPTTTAGGELALAEPPSLEAAREAFELEQDLAQAIAEEQLTMVFQPVVDLARGRVIGAEALLRWDHPRLGSVSPARFIPVVESIGMSERYGLWVLNAAAREARRWRDEGLVGLKVAVNLSARQLLDPQLRTKIERTLLRHDLPANALELELTETATMADATRTHALFGELRALGISLAIDDFGSGYSSLSYLKNLPFDKLKIDREFVTAVDTRRDCQAICKALIELGRGLDLVVLAEGVETPAEVEALCALGCTVFQGYHFSKPLSGDAFTAFARDPGLRARIARPSARKPRLQDRLSA